MAHVAVTTTLPVLGCLWLEKVTHTRAKNKLNTLKRLQPQNSCKGSTCLLSLLTIHTKHSGQHGEGRALITKQPKCSFKQNLRDSSKPAQLTGACRSTDRLVQKPNQPRLLSTSYNSWHSMSDAVWQLRATFATSQSCRKRAIASPDPCSPMTNNAPLATLCSLELLDEKDESLSIRQESSSAIMCKPTKAHSFTASTGDAGPKPNQLPEDHRLFLQKEEEELAVRPVSLWHIPLRGGCAQTHTVPSIQKRPQDLFPQRLHQF